VITKIDSVDYSQHPVFETSQKAWNCSEELLSEFSNEYEHLQNGIIRDESILQSIAAQIRMELLSQTENLTERQFVEEVFLDVEKQLSDQVYFYKKKSRHLKKVKSLDLKQRELQQKGFYVTSLSKSAMKKISSITSSSLSRLQHNAEIGKRERQDLSVNSGIAILRVVRALNRDFKKAGVLKSLDSISSGKFKVVGVAFELSVAGSTWWQPRFDSTAPPKTLYAHVDRQVDAPKAIVYLTDVGVDNGPTSCYPDAYKNLNINGLQDFIGRSWENIGRSPSSPLSEMYNFSGPVMDSEAFRNHFMRLPESLRFNSHFGWDVAPNSELEDYLVSREFHVLGPAGTTLVFDGARLLHRGGLITSDQRVVLQVVFGHVTLRQKMKQVFQLLKRIMTVKK